MQHTKRNHPKKSSNSAELKKRLVSFAYLQSSSALVDWDQMVNLPPKATGSRAKTLAELHALLHEKFLYINHDGLLDTCKKEAEQGKIAGDDAIIIRDLIRAFDRTRKLPEDFVRELSETISISQSVWAKARATSDFSLFKPQLEKIIALKQQEAEYVGYKNSPYDALIDEYEPDMTAQEAEHILIDLKNFLIPFLANYRHKKISFKKINDSFPVAKQHAFTTFLAQKIGFDLEAGRIDVSTHPFTTSFHPTDVRFTTRFDEKNALYALGSTIHETGHALYEQGLPSEHFGTALGQTVSLGIHESQSRMWENNIGKSLEFWKYFHPQLQKQFPQPFKTISLQEFYDSYTHVKPSFIRTESDEVTYNLHIIIRFEIEKDLIEGKIKVKDVPHIWNEKVTHYLGLTVKNDREGMLQDVHWSAGLIGYFPTYSFGNLYAAQFYNKMQQDIPNIKKLISIGNFQPILAWLRKNIHSHGKRYSAQELVKKVTGETLQSHYFADYIEKKYTL